MVLQPLHASFVLRPSHRPQELHLEYTHRELTVPAARLPTTTTTTSTSSSTDSHDEDDNAVRLPPVAIQSSPTATAAATTTAAGVYEQVEEDSSFRLPLAKRSRTTVLPWNKAIHTIPNLQSEFEPPSDANYWKQRCFHWQSICQDTRQKLREMQEDQRQLRKRLWQLEEQVVWAASRPTTTPSSLRDTTLVQADPLLPVASSSTQVPVSPTSQDHRQQQQKQQQRPPKWIVTIPTTRKCCFYLTDSEGLSDSEYVDDDDIMDDTYPPDDDDHDDEEDENNDNDRNDKPQQHQDDNDDDDDHRETKSHGKDTSASCPRRQDCPQEPSGTDDSPNKTRFTTTNQLTSNSPPPDPASEQADSKCTDDAVVAVGIKVNHNKHHAGIKIIKQEPREL